MAKVITSIPGDNPKVKAKNALLKRIARTERQLSKLDLHREKDRDQAETFREQILKWTEESKEVKDDA